MALYTTAKLQLDMQPFRDAALAMADMELAHASKLVTGSELRAYVDTVDRALATAQKSNPKLAEGFATQNAALQGDVTQNINMQQSFEKSLSDFIAQQNEELRKLMQEVKKGALTENDAKQKFIATFIRKSDELIKKFKGYSLNEKKVQDTLEHLLKSLLTAFPATRSEDAAKLLAKTEVGTPTLGSK